MVLDFNFFLFSLYSLSTLEIVYSREERIKCFSFHLILSEKKNRKKNLYDQESMG